MPLKQINLALNPDITQEQIDERIALGQYASGTTTADIVLNSDYNALADAASAAEPVIELDDGLVLFSSSGAVEGDSNLVWDNVNKRLGIGTGSPASALHISRDSSTTDGITVQMGSSSGANTLFFKQVWANGNNAGAIGTRGTSWNSLGIWGPGATLTGNPNMTISTTEIGVNVDLRDTTGTLVLKGNAASGNPDVMVETSSAARQALVVKGFASQTANLQEWHNSSGTALSVVDKDGKLGIGTSAPDVKLVVKSANNTSLDPTIKILSNNETVSLSLAYNGIVGSNDFRLSTNGTERLYVSNAGRVGIGTDSPASALCNYASTTNDSSSIGISSAGFLWSTNVNIVGYTAIIENRVSATTNRNALLVKNAATDSASYVARFESGGTNRFTIRGDGNVGVNTLSPSAQFQTNASSASTVGQIVRGAASQTANLLEAQDSSSNTYFSVGGKRTMTANGEAITTIDGYFTPASGVQVHGTKITVDAGSGSSSGGTLLGAEYAPKVSSTSNPPTLVVGAQYYPQINGTQTVASVQGLRVQSFVNATATISSFYSARIADIFSAGGTVTNQYGLYIDSLTTGGTNYAIYTNSGAVRFGDAVTIAGGTVTASKPLLNITQTWNDASVVFEGAVINITNTNSQIGSTLFSVKLGGSSIFRIRRDGTTFCNSLATTTGNLQAAFGSTILFDSSSRINAPSDGILRFTNSSSSDFSRLQLGGTTSSYPAIKRNGAALNFRLADDSADCAITAGAATFSGAVTLAENASIALDPAGSADGKYTGITVTGTAGAALVFGNLVYIDPTDSRWELVHANAAAGADGDARGIIGICVLAAAGDGSATTILLQGIVRADTAFPSMTIGGQVYASETAGDITQTMPTTTDAVIRVLGVAITENEIYFNPSPDYITHV